MNRAQIRRRSREIALQLIYQLDMRHNLDIEAAIALYPANDVPNKDFMNELYPVIDDNNIVNKSSLSEREQEEAFSYACELVRGLVNNFDEVFEMLRDNVIGWRLERMVAVDKAAIALALYEGVLSKKVPIPVAISEAVELSKIYGTSDSGRFVNGVLGRIVRKEKTE